MAKQEHLKKQNKEIKNEKTTTHEIGFAALKTAKNMGNKKRMMSLTAIRPKQWLIFSKEHKD